MFNIGCGTLGLHVSVLYWDSFLWDGVMRISP